MAFFGGKYLIAYYLKKYRIAFPVDHRCISAFGFFGGKKPMKENVSFLSAFYGYSVWR